MKAAVFESANKLSIQDKPIPKLESGDVLIKVELCGICASDLMALKGEITDYSPPVVMGHELSGIVTESRHNAVTMGERITVNPMISCGKCHYCRKDLDKYCQELYGIGHDIDGGYAEYLRVPKQAVENGCLLSVPDEIPTEEVMFIEALGCCLNAMRETIFHESLAILGAGSIGLTFVKLAKLKGLQTFVVEPLEHRRKMAEQLDADGVANLDEIPKLMDITNGGVDTVILATNNVDALDLMFELAKRGACLNFFGLFPKGNELKLELEDLHFMGYKILASWAFSRWSMNEARKMIVEGNIKFDGFLTHCFPLERAVEAFENGKNRCGVKTALAP
ncbi:alcohol dehydrogenase catalytic domain-containing protein [bacterium]|nr:alcohol dehydrogenase catalytic domain-containing protein [bacterium]